VSTQNDVPIATRYPAERELDVLIAERVMGYRTMFDDIAGDYYLLNNQGDDLGMWVPYYSALPKDAELVIYRINIAMLAVFTEHYGARAVARIMQYQNEHWPNYAQIHAAEGKTAPHAICLVALDWIEEECRDVE
jgi:hypothetical protein